MHNELTTNIDELELWSVIKLVVAPDAPPYYQHVFDINVLTSINEYLGISVIVTDYTGSREAADKDLTNLILKKTNLTRLSADILCLSKNTEP